MSSAGFPTLALYDPELFAKQQAIARNQAMAQSLMEQPMGTGGYAGLASAGRSLLGAYLQRKSLHDMADMLQTGQSQPASGYSQAPAAAAPQADQSQTDAEGTPVSSYQQPAPRPQMAQAPAPSVPSDKPADYTSLPPQLQRLYDQIPHIPGMPAQQAVNYFLINPSAYQAAWAKQYDQTDLEKNVAAAYGPGSPEAKAMLQGTLGKGASVNIRPGGGNLNMATGQVFTMPNQQGIQTTYPYGANGPAVNQLVPGGAEALAGATGASQYGKASATPAIGYVNGQPVATNQAALLGNGTGQPQYSLPGGPNINANNPLNMQPGGQEARYATPTAGLGAAWENLSNYANRGINTVNGIVRAWAGPNAPPEYAANVAKSLGVDPNQPLNLRDPNVKGLLIDAMRPNETGNRYGSQSQQGSAMLPELPAGQKPYMEAQGKDAGERHDATVQAAAESPMRINVLDNIIGLSQSGVATGPGQEWQNSVLGYASNLPGLSRVMGGAKDNVAKFQELQKFTYQNAIRSWQAAGGTGTDAQMESMAHANPNDKLFPQALQQIAKWGKAAELAVQGKANAQDRWLAQNGQTPQNQISFENAWRNNFDPKVFQYSLMTPQEKLNFAHTQLKTPQAAKAFLAKQQTLQAMGAIQ